MIEPTLIPRHCTALAPMQDVTTLSFMQVISRYGAPDLFFTEYFRVHASSRLEPHILDSITKNPSGKPVFAQLIGESVPDLIRTVEALLEHPIAGIDLNMGCPAPKVYKKNVGGGLLRDLERVGQILPALREATQGRCPFTVKMRIGFEDDRHFAALLDLIEANAVDLLSLHGRTVREMYRSQVHYDHIRRAVERLKIPVLANGDISSVSKAVWCAETTGCHGYMIGRHAIRNPWIFRQLREHYAGQPVFRPSLLDVRQYIADLHAATHNPELPEMKNLGKLKKFLNFVGQSVDAEGVFLYKMRRTRSLDELFNLCDQMLVAADRAALLYADEPYPGLHARPTREAPTTCSL